MCCEGKCHLEKQLKKDEQIPTAKVPIVMKLKEIVENISLVSNLKFIITYSENSYSIYKKEYEYSFPNSLLRPPQLVI